MSDLQRYNSLKQHIARAKGWAAHFEGKGRNNGEPRVSSVGANPTINIQYDTGGTNYWEAKEYAGEEFMAALEKVMRGEAKRLSSRAIQLMEEELLTYKDKAKQEYKSLFDEDLAA